MSVNLPHASERLALPAAEAAKLLDISERHFWAMHASGKLGPLPIRLGRATRWRLSELQASVEAGCPSRDRWLARTLAAFDLGLADDGDNRPAIP